MFNVSTVFVIHYFKSVFSPISCCLKVTIAKRWAGLGNLVKFIGQPAVDAVYGMEKRDVEPALGVFKECEGLMPDRLSSIVLYMSDTKSSVLGINREIKLASVEQLWSWHVLHPDAVTEGFVHESRRMLTYSALLCTLSGSDFVVFILLLTLSWAKFRPGPSILFISIPFFNCLICVLCIPSAANLSTVTMCKEQCRMMAHIWILYGSCVWSPESPWPPWASVVNAVFWASDLCQGLRDRLRKPRVTPSIEKADSVHMTLKLGDTIVEKETGKVVKEEGRVELLPLWPGCLVPSCFSALPFVCILIGVARMWTSALHKNVAQFVLNGILVAVPGETADVRVCVSNPKAACAEEFFHADVSVYNLSKPSALYSMGHTALALCILHQFSARPPRYLSYIQGPLTSAIPVEVCCYLLYPLDLI